MSDQDVIQNIIRECTEHHGFLVKLHAHRMFDKERYTSLIDNLLLYRTLLGEQPEVSRSVAGCLLALQQEIDNHIRRSSQGQTSTQEIADIAAAYEEIWQIIHEILKINALNSI